MATLIQFCNRCEERKYLKLCKKCTQYLCSDCKRDHICEVSSGPSTLYSFSENLKKDTDNKPYQCRTHLKEAIRFCFTCTNQLCEECLDTVETEHNGHVIYNIENAAKEIRKQTETKIASLKEQIDKARKQKHELDKHRFSSSEKRNSRREVSNLASNLASAIVAAIEDQQRLDKDIIAEGVTKLQNTIDVWMDINRALYKISTAYNDLENIHLFKKYKTAQKNPEFPTIRTRAEFPDDRRFRHSELIQIELRTIMNFLESA